MAKFSIAILELLDHNEFTVKDPFNFDNFAKEISTYTSLDAESLLTNISLSETIINCVSDLHNKNL